MFINKIKRKNWENKDEINVLFEVKEGKKGVFLFKKES
jgi:hypothetical protein